MINKVESLTTVSVFIMYVFFAGFFFPLLGLLLFGGIENTQFFEKSIFYYSGLGISLITLLSLYFYDSQHKWFKIFLFNPKEMSLFKDTLFIKYLTFGNVVHFSILFSLLMALYSTTSQTFFTGKPAEMQVTETSKLILATEPAAISETLIAIVPLSMLFSYVLYFLHKRKITFGSFYFASLLTLLAGTMIWTAIHIARYGSQETTLLATLIFGALGTFLTLLAGSLIPWYIWHFFNNLFNKANELFSSETTVAWIIVIIIVYIVLLVLYKVIRNKSSSRTISIS